MENLPAIAESDSEPTAFWTQHVEAWRQTSLSQREYVRQHDLPVARFTYWKNKLYPGNKPADFVRVDIANSSLVRIHHPSGTVIECQSGTDTHWLQALLGITHAP